jgi:hypothetical protein
MADIAGPSEQLRKRGVACRDETKAPGQASKIERGGQAARDRCLGCQSAEKTQKFVPIQVHSENFGHVYFLH